MDTRTFAFVAKRMLDAQEGYEHWLDVAERSGYHPSRLRHVAEARLAFELDAVEFVRVIAEIASGK